MYATQYVGSATEFEGRINNGKKEHVEHLVDMTKPGTFTQDGLLGVSGLRDSVWFGPSGHFR